MLDQPINSQWFLAYVEQALVPTLKPGDVVVMDNLGSHKGRACARRSEKPALTFCSCRPTAPTSTPSSRSFSKLKTLLRKADERCVETVWRRIGHLLDRFSPEECANYLVNSGYAPN